MAHAHAHSCTCTCTACTHNNMSCSEAHWHCGRTCIWGKIIRVQGDEYHSKAVEVKEVEATLEEVVELLGDGHPPCRSYSNRTHFDEAAHHTASVVVFERREGKIVAYGDGYVCQAPGNGCRSSRSTKDPKDAMVVGVIGAFVVHSEFRGHPDFLFVKLYLVRAWLRAEGLRARAAWLRALVVAAAACSVAARRVRAWQLDCMAACSVTAWLHGCRQRGCMAACVAACSVAASTAWLRAARLRARAAMAAWLRVARLVCVRACVRACAAMAACSVAACSEAACTCSHGCVAACGAAGVRAWLRAAWLGCVQHGCVQPWLRAAWLRAAWLRAALEQGGCVHVQPWLRGCVLGCVHA